MYSGKRDRNRYGGYNPGMHRVLLVASCSLLACSPLPAQTQSHGQAPATTRADKLTPAQQPPHDTPVAEGTPPRVSPSPAPSPNTPVAPARDLITSAQVLASLEAGPANLGTLLHGQPAANMAELARGPRMAAINRVLNRDFDADASNDKRLGVGMRHSHRQFDRTWLVGNQNHVELIGVVNRLDRRPFAPEHCGETRLIYRLAYRTNLDGEQVESRLPMTFNVVFWQDPDGEAQTCKQVGERWSIAPSVTGDALVARLSSPNGPLAPERLTAQKLKSVEVNLQSARWPAAVHPGMAGHAEYILRVFHPDGEGLVPAKLENTPDLAQLKRDRQLREELLSWLTAPAQRTDLDAGTLNVPDKFLAERATSVTPRGFARLANRPYRQLFKPKDFADYDFSGLTHVKSPLGLLRRLDGLTCNGCHESRSVAGFHLLGEPRDPTAVLDTLAIATSPHLDGERERRSEVLAAVLAGDQPDDRRPLSEAERHQGAAGSHCGLGDRSFTHLTCDSGLVCTKLDDPELGTCLPQGAPAGAPCEVGEMAMRAHPHADRVRGAKQSSCREGAVCNRNKVGFPQGMCTATCDDLGAGERCGAIVDLLSFNLCIGQKKPFPGCIKTTAHPAGMQACGPNEPCRDDYICARSPNADGGVCIPPYFLFQMRVDGHVLAG